MSVFGLFDFYTPEALFLLLLLPVWWLWRRHRRKDAIVFSRTSVLAEGPAQKRPAGIPVVERGQHPDDELARPE